MALEFPRVTINVFGRDPAGRFKSMADHMVDAMRLAITRQTEALERQVKSNIASKFKNPGLMQSAVGHKVTRYGDGFVGEVDVSGEITGVRMPFGKRAGQKIPFMAIHEFGGTIRIPAIFPVQKKALWYEGARHPFPMAKAHTANIRSRSYLRLALEQRQAQIREAFTTATIKSVEQE